MNGALQMAHLNNVVGLQQFQAVAQPAKRLVRVLVVDTDSNVPAKNSKIFDEEMFTTLSNDKINLSIDVKDALEKHNALRVKFYRETQEGNKIYLKALELSDITVTVIQLAVFNAT